MAVVGNAYRSVYEHRYKRHPRGCLSIFNLSIEICDCGRDIIEAGSIPRSTKGPDRIEVLEDEEPRRDSPTSRIEGGRFIFVRFCALSARCHFDAAASLLLPCPPRRSSRVLHDAHRIPHTLLRICSPR